MAVVKMHQVRATLHKATEYVVQASKTQDGAWVTSYACSADGYQAASDMLLLQDEANQIRTTGKTPTVLGVHVIQSFEPGELDADTAHEIGTKFAAQITGGDHQWVLATHTDRGHIHNHLIFNPVNMSTLQRYRTPKNEIFRLRTMSDDLCRQYGLSVIEPDIHREPEPTLGERHARTRGASTKDALRWSIDQAVVRATNLTELIEELAKSGIEVTFKGRDMLVRNPDTMGRAVRVWRLGPAYSESNLASRLGQAPVTTFTVAPPMVHELDKNTLKVAIPKLRGYFLAVPKQHAADHGNTWHLHLPTASTTPVINRQGNFEVAFTPEQLTDWFTPYEDNRIAAPTPTKSAITTRGRTDAQRAYFASVDRRAARLSARVDAINLKAELFRMTPTERSELASATEYRLALSRATLTRLVLARDNATGTDRQDLETQIDNLVRVIGTDKQALAALLQGQPERQQKGQRR